MVEINIPNNDENVKNGDTSDSSLENSTTTPSSDIVEKPNKSTPQTVKSSIPKSHILETQFTFLFIGMGGVLNWTVVMNCILPIFSTVYNFPRGADTILLGYFFFSFIIAIMRFFKRSLNPNFVYAGIYLLYLCNIILPLTIYLTDGTMGIILIHAIGSIIGLSVSMLISSGMAYGGMIPVNMTGFVMGGQGLSGLFGFLLWQFWTQIFFNIYIKEEIRYASWATFLICIFPIFLIHIFFRRLQKRNWFEESYNNFLKTSKVKLDPEYAQQFKLSDHSSLIFSQNNLVGCRPVKYIFKDIFLSMFMGITTITITFSLFPNIGPYDFNGRTIAEVTILVGIYQTMDFVGRMSPNFSRKFILPYLALKVIVPIRLLFYPLFIMSAEENSAVFTNFAFQGLLLFTLAFSNGFISSQAIADIPRCVLTTAERGVAGLILNICMQLGLFSAIALSQITKTLYGLA